MIKETIQKAINDQITKEMYSSNLYLSMAAYYHNLNLNGFANWMRVQAQEEETHALRLFDYLLERGGRPLIGEIKAPQIEWESPLAAFEASLKHEEFVTSCINQLADLASKEGDHATGILLQWFITEQVEEESTVTDIVQRLKMMENYPGGYYLMDNELKQRQFVDPFAAGNKAT